MNADLHMADDLKNTGKGNLFVIFGEPDISVASEECLEAISQILFSQDHEGSKFEKGQEIFDMVLESSDQPAVVL